MLITLSDVGAAKVNEVRTTRTALVARRLARLDDTQRATIAAACRRWRLCWSTTS